MKPQKSDDALNQARKALAAIDRNKTEQIIREDEFTKPSKGLDEIFLGFSVGKKIAQARQASKVFNAAAKAVETTMRYAGPVGRGALTIGGWLKSAFKYAAFEHDEKGDYKLDADGDLIFSPKRLATKFLLATMIGTSSIVAAQYGYFEATKFEQTIYTSGKDTVTTGELYEVTGCTSLPCDTQADNGEFFHIKQSWYAPRLLYPENDVYAIIPKNEGVCKINGYGLYIKELKFMHKMLEFYPNIYQAKCRPYTQAEIENTIQSGKILDSSVLDQKPGTPIQLQPLVPSR